jgi:hypothetical protein
MKRRLLLQWLGAAIGTVRLPIGARAQTPAPAEQARIRSIAEAVLPDEIGAAEHDKVVAGFLAWLRDYRPGADTDHGYGFTRLRKLPDSPAAKYPAQLDALEAAARGRGSSFPDLSRDDRRSLLEAAITAARIERLPSRPDGGHIATDLMGFYFNSIDANDRCYRSAIGRDLCRGLDGSSERPAPLMRGGR